MKNAINELHGPLEKTALIIQEDIIMRRILERLVEMSGFSVKACRSIDDLSEKEQEVLFDLVISDILFNDGISSFDFAFRLENEISSKQLFIVTKMGQEVIRQNFLSMDRVDRFFGVPFDLDLLEQEVIKLA